MIFLAAMRDGRDGKATRKALMATIRERPGIHKAALCEASGLAWGTVHYHLRVLERRKDIVIDSSLREARIFAAQVSPRQRAWIRVMSNPHGPRIMDELAPDRGQAVSELSERLGLSPKVVRTQLTRFHEEGLVEREGDHRPEYRATHDALQDLTPPPPELYG